MGELWFSGVSSRYKMGTLAGNEFKKEFERVQQKFRDLQNSKLKLSGHNKDCYVGLVFTNAAVHHAIRIRKAVRFL